MSQDNSLDVCFLENNICINEFLNGLGVPKAQQKKYLTKKQLSFVPRHKQSVKLPIELINYLKINPCYSGPEIKVLYEDDIFLAFHKPQGVHSHPLSYIDTLNCLSFFESKKSLQNTSSYDRTLLYRLDFVTSGVLVLCKNERDYFSMRENFHEVAKEKVYFAIVEGVGIKEGYYQHLISSMGAKKAKMKEDPQGKKAQLEIVEVHSLEKSKLSLVKIKLKTGLRHQIRLQLSLLGYPILGDTLYGGSEHQRVFLHAYQYSFIFNGKEHSFCSQEATLFDTFFNLNSFL